MKRIWMVMVAMAVLIAPVVAGAVTFTASGTNSASGQALAAKAVFTITASGQLQVVLTNTSADGAKVPSDVLTAVFFSVSGATLSPYSAKLGGSTIVNPPSSYPVGWDGNNLGGEYAYGSGLSGAPNGANSGISAVGFGLFGSANFNGPVLFTPPPDLQLDGLDAGIVSAIDPDANNKVTGVSLIQNSVTFLLNITGTLDLANITNVSFQYGTSLTEPNIKVPEASTLLLLGSGLLGLAGFATRKKFRK